MRDHVLSWRIVGVALNFTLIFLPTAAHAFPDDEARRAINELRQTLQQQSAQSLRARSQLAAQIQALQQQITRLRDQLELVTHQQARTSAPPNTRSNPSQAGNQEQSAYQSAMDLFRKGQYQEVSAALRTFITQYPNSMLLPMAQFYLGSSRYAVKDFHGAIEPLQQMVKLAPNNARAPDALLVIAGSQIELNNRTGAKATLQQITKDYPATLAAETAQNRLQLLR